jgi:glyoxylase-like metal-dependent hydrolase (beta-lactamase superfamily II)
MFGAKITPLDISELNETNTIKIGTDFNFNIYHTPGHSLGSICFYEASKRILIPGDLVFVGGSFGRYDFPGGSLKILQNSIKFVNELDVEFLLPGHMGISDNGNKQIELSYRMVHSIGAYY